MFHSRLLWQPFWRSSDCPVTNRILCSPQFMKIRHKASSILNDVSQLSYSSDVTCQTNNRTTSQCCGRLRFIGLTQCCRGAKYSCRTFSEKKGVSETGVDWYTVVIC